MDAAKSVDDCWKFIWKRGDHEESRQVTSSSRLLAIHRFINNFIKADEDISAQRTGDIIGQFYLVILRH